ncbi:unnamed protein product, partial [Meganyctiphanes norvegica]
VILLLMTDSVATHPAFRSAVSTINNTEDIDDLVGSALVYQHMFDRRTSPWEMQNWDYDELQKFKVKLNRVDRLYYIYHYDDEISSRSYEILVRMDYKEEKLFVHLAAGCDFTGFDCQGGGEIYITRNPNIFLKSVVGQNHNPSLIYNCLLEDGYRVEEPTQFDLSPRKMWNSVPALRFLTHQAIHKHQEHLNHYPEVLP